MNNLMKLCLLSIVLLISACGGGGGSSNPGNSGPNIPIPNPIVTTTTINNFSVSGSSAPISGKVPINANINSGQFSIDWDVVSTNPYTFELFISEDAVLNSDTSIITLNCGPDPLVYNCDQTGQYDCRFDTGNLMSCGVISPGNTAKDLTAFLDTIPKDAFLIIEACTAIRDDCKTSSVSIELQ